MRSLLKKLWSDDAGAILSVEWTLLASVMVMGVSAGAVAVRDAVNAQMANVANSIQNMTPQFTFSGWRTPSASVAGYQSPYVAVPVTIQQVAPNVIVQQWNLLPPAP